MPTKRTSILTRTNAPFTVRWRTLIQLFVQSAMASLTSTVIWEDIWEDMWEDMWDDMWEDMKGKGGREGYKGTATPTRGRIMGWFQFFTVLVGGT